MGILFENCDLLLRGEDGGYSTLHGFLGVRGDTIDYIGAEKPTGEYEEHKSMEHKLLMPGLINCHNHSPMVLLRGVGSGLPLREWLFDKVFPIEDRLVPEDIAAGSRLAILEMLASGTTSFSDMYFFPAETVAAVAEAGMKANISRCVQCFDENQTVEQNTQIPQSVELFEKYHNAENGASASTFPFMRSIPASRTSSAPTASSVKHMVGGCTFIFPKRSVRWMSASRAMASPPSRGSRSWGRWTVPPPRRIASP